MILTFPRGPNQLILSAAFLIFALSSCQNEDPTQATSADPEAYRFLFESEGQIQDLQINSFENELILLGLELTPEAEEYIAAGQALVGLLASDMPLLHANGVVEMSEEQEVAMDEFETEGTDPRLPAAFRTFEARVVFGMFNPALSSHRQVMREYLAFKRSGLPASDSRFAGQATTTDRLCGDGVCNYWNGEDAASCSDDCSLSGAIQPMGAPPLGSCGDGVCDPTIGETFVTCPQDCVATTICGDGICDPTEDAFSCPADCGGFCGDLICDPAIGESCMSCVPDCGMCPGDDDDSAMPGDDDDSTVPGDDDDIAVANDDDTVPGDDDDTVPGDDDDIAVANDDDTVPGDDDDSTPADDDDSAVPGDDDDTVPGDDDDSTPADPENTTQLCSDGADNDGDGEVDCDDADCEGTAACSCAADCYPIWTSTQNTPGSVSADWTDMCSNGGYGRGAYTGSTEPLGDVSAWCRGKIFPRATPGAWIVGDRTMTFNSCHVEGSTRIRCDWNDTTGQACIWGSTTLDRAACAGTGKDTGSMSLTTKAEAGYGGFFSPAQNRNKGTAAASGTLKAAHWQTGTEKYVDGNTTIATKAGSINCTLKPVTFDCKLQLTATGPPSPGCSIGAGFSCATVPPAGSVNQTWTSSIQSTSTDADIPYAAATNSVSVGGKGVKGAAEVYAKNGASYISTSGGHGPSTGYWWLQGAEGKANVRSVVEANLEAVSVIRENPNVTTTCTKVAPPESPDLASSIRISCGERLVE